jgi:peptidoglycan hydrolase-like protein with peptidoglycan-binding domain
MAQGGNGEEHRVTGLVIPLAWGPKGQVRAVGIAAYDESLYRVAPGPRAGPLMRLVQQEVTAWGQLSEQGGKKMIQVTRFSRSRTKRGTLTKLAAAALAVGLAAGGAWAAQPAGQTAPAGPKPAAVGAAQAAGPAKAAATQAGRQAAKKRARPSARVAELQKALGRVGHRLKADGLMGKRTRAALKAFQQKQGLKPTGRPDAATKKALGLG